MPTTPEELALRATRNAHALCLRRSGDNCLGDIPLSISISMLPFDEKQDEPQGRITTHRFQIKPDVGRLLNPKWVSDDLYERARNSKNALTEGEGAERLSSVLAAQYGSLEPGKQQRMLRYSMRGRRDMRLIRNYLWREGHSWLPTEAMRYSMRIVDVRHAVLIIAGACRATGTWNTLPKGLRDYDLNSRELTAAVLCGFYRVPVPDQGTESSALFRLVLTAREAAYGRSGAEAPEQEPSRVGHLKTLGDTLDYLDGAAGNPSSSDTLGNERKQARRFLPPVDSKGELTPSKVGLLLHDGAWLPVVQPKLGDRPAGTARCLYSLPEGRRLERPVNISAPLLPLNFLASESGWTAAADARLRRICGREGETFDFPSLREAFAQAAGGWHSPEPNLTPLPLPTSNPWTQLHEYPPNAEQYAAAGEAAYANNRSDARGARIALDELAKHAEKGGPNARRAAQLLLHNMRLTASRADLLNDGRKAWLGQMALLPDPEAWPDNRPFIAHYFSIILYGDGPVAQHNRIAVASRSALGIPASKAALALVSQPPRGLNAVQALRNPSSRVLDELPPQAKLLKFHV